MFRAVRGPLLILVVIALLILGLWLWLRTSLPAVEGRVVLSGLADTVVVIRDEFGVPSIEAGSHEDLYFALGFVHAQDRLWQMEYRRQAASGSLAGLLGEEALANDLLMRTLGLRSAAERTVDQLGPRAVGALQAYSDGVNAFIASHGGGLPLEFQLLGHTPREWTPVDTAAIQKLAAWEWNGSLTDELVLALLALRLEPTGLREIVGAEIDARWRELYRDLPLARLFELLPTVRGARSSHGWVLAGERTVDGWPLLATEGYGRPSAPAPWYLVRMRTSGVTIAGATLPGTPVVVSGRNDRIAWSLLPDAVDVQDLVLLPAAGREGSRLVEGQPHGFESRRETIPVRGGEEVALEVRESAWGPVVSDLVGRGEPAGGDEGQPSVALRWSAGMAGDRTLQGALDLVQAGDWDEFRAAASNLDELHGTALYADVEGRIGSQEIGRRPVRGPGEGRLPAPLDAHSESWEWVPFSRLDSRIDPPSEIVSSGGPAAGPVIDLVRSLRAQSVRSSARVLAAEYPPGVSSLLAVLRSAVPSSPLAREAHAQLLGWDGLTDTSSAAPVIYEAWVSALARELLADEIGAQLAGEMVRYPHLLRRAIVGGRWCADAAGEANQSCSSLVSRALEEGVAELAELYGPRLTDWPRELQGARAYRHEVFERTLIAPLFRVGEAGEGADTTRSDYGAAPGYRAVYELAGEESGDWGSSGFLIPTGQSGNPFSPNYRDLLARWLDLELLPLQPDRTDGERRLLLEPRR